MRRIALLMILSLICAVAYPQSQLDSLIRVAEQAQGDSISIAYNAVGIHLTYSNPQASFEYLEKALVSARQYKNYKQQCVACSFMGTSARYLGNYSKALHHFNEQLEVARSQNITDEIVWSNINMGNIMTYMKNYELAKDYLETALREAQDLGDESIFQYVYVNLGRVNLLAKDYAQAINYHNMALQIRRQHPESAINIAVSLRDLGSAYFERRWFDSTKYYYGLAMSVLDTLPHNAVKGSIYTNLAHIYVQDGQMDSAVYFSNLAEKTAHEFSNVAMQSDASLVMGHVQYALGNYAAAEKNYMLRIAYDDNLRTSDVQKQILYVQNRNNQAAQDQQILAVERDSRIQRMVFAVLAITLLAGLILTVIVVARRRHQKEVQAKLDAETKSLKSSIEYAGKIQQSILPNFDRIVKYFPDKFLLHITHEAVSGDYYWHHDTGRYEMFGVAYTGVSGIPGGCISMVSSSLLHLAVEKYVDPAMIIGELHRNATGLMSGRSFEGELSQMDISLMVVDKESGVLYYSGNKSPLIYVRKGEVGIIQDNNASCNMGEKRFSTDVLHLEQGDRIYIMNAQCYMQKGGPDGEPYSLDRLIGLIRNICKQPMSAQKDAIRKEFDSWRGDASRMDDVSIAGFIYWK